MTLVTISAPNQRWRSVRGRFGLELNRRRWDERGVLHNHGHRFRWPWATRPFWLIDAFRVFCKVIARKREGAQSRASTQTAEFAITAFCPSSCPIGEAFETAASSGRLPSENSGERFPPKGEEPTGIDFARMRDEHQSLAIIDARLALNHLIMRRHALDGGAPVNATALVRRWLCERSQDCGSYSDRPPPTVGRFSRAGGPIAALNGHSFETGCYRT